MVKHYLASSNTGKKFVCKFDNILDHSKNEFLYIIKGGSGTGKSTLMKRVGRYFEELKEDVEYFYCSSDSNSLDGVRVKNRNIAIVDGTAPHIMETKMIGIKDTIIDLGKYINNNIKSNEKEIKKYSNKKSNCFYMVENYLSSAFSVLNNSLGILQNFVRRNYVSRKVKEITEKLKLERRLLKGNKRELFYNCLDGSLLSKNKYEKEIVLEFTVLENHNILKKLIIELEKKNYNFIVFYNIINPEIIDGIEIEDLNTIIFGNSKNQIRDKKLNQVLQKNDELILELLLFAKDSLIMARNNHFKVEQSYIKNMDFNKLNDTYDWLIGDMLQK